jgi:hypothetical protein
MRQPRTEKELKKRHDRQHNNPALPGVLYDENIFRDIYYVLHNTKVDLVEALHQTPQAAWQFAKKHW